MKRIVVAGASLAGLRALEALRAEGFDGELIAIGDEPELPYDRPPLSKQFLTGDWDEERIRLRRQGVEDLDVTWHLGERASALLPDERKVQLASGETIAWDALLIATGSMARELPFGAGLAGVQVLRSLADARALRESLGSGPRVAVIGAGFIGMEVAASCRQRGLDVTVIEPLAAPLIRGLGEALGRHVADRFRAEGVDLRLGAGVEGFDGEGRVEAVRLTDGKRLPADVVVVGIGVRPATDWLAGSGLDVRDGVACDGAGATASEGVFAAGDVARWAAPDGTPGRRYEHWTHAVEQGVHAARRILHGESAGTLDVVPYVWSDQFDLRIAIAGEPSAGDDSFLCHGSLEEGRFLVLFGHEDRLCGAVSFGRPRQLHAVRRRIAEGALFSDVVAENA